MVASMFMTALATAAMPVGANEHRVQGHRKNRPANSLAIYSRGSIKSLVIPISRHQHSRWRM